MPRSPPVHAVLFGLLASLASGGCSGGGTAGVAPDLPCGASSAQVDEHATVTTGVYGRVYAAAGTARSPDWCGQDYTLALFDPGDSAMVSAIAHTTSDSGGFYEMSVDSGPYQLCMVAGNTSFCTQLTVYDGKPARRDLAISDSGAQWQ